MVLPKQGLGLELAQLEQGYRSLGIEILSPENFFLLKNKIRDLFKVKLFPIRSETKKKERKEIKRETLNIY